MRFRGQLVVGIGLILVVATSVSVVSVAALHAGNSRAGELAHHVFDDVVAVQTVRVRAEQVVSAARGYLLTGDEDYRRKLADHEQRLDVALEGIRGSYDHAISTSLALVEQQLRDYSRATAAAAQQRSTGHDRFTLERTFEEQVAPRRRALDDAVGLLVVAERERIQAQTKRVNKVGRRLVIAALVACCLGIGLSIVLGCVVVRKLDRHYKREQQAKQEAAEAALARKQLLDIVAHDLLSPLNAIVLGIELMEMDGRRVPSAGAIKGSAERMQRLVRDLLDVSRAETLGLELAIADHDVSSLLAEMREQCEEAARRSGVALRVDAPQDLRANVDRDRIFQVLANLIGNALKCAHKGDTVVLGARSLPSGGARFFVTDSGPGIPREQLDELFQAYRQGADKARRGSLGLGLHICKTLVEAHGGRIGAEGAAGKGTTFWFEIPVAVKPSTTGDKDGSEQGSMNGLASRPSGRL